jgi:hypothetical protein
MLIEVTVNNDKWIRADLIDTDEKIKNLYHLAYHPRQGVIQQYNAAAYYVRTNFPELQKVRIVTDIGIHTTMV